MSIRFVHVLPIINMAMKTKCSVLVTREGEGQVASEHNSKSAIIMDVYSVYSNR